MTAALPLALAVFAPPAFPDPALVGRLSEKRPEFNYREENVPAYTLPPVLGDAAAAAEWPARRAELVRLFERHVYGIAPPAPDAVAFDAEEESLGGALWRTVSVECVTPGGPFAFPVTIALPAGASAESPAPLFVLINNRGPELISKGDGGDRVLPVAGDHRRRVRRGGVSERRPRAGQCRKLRHEIADGLRDEREEPPRRRVRGTGGVGLGGEPRVGLRGADPRIGRG